MLVEATHLTEFEYYFADNEKVDWKTMKQTSSKTAGTIIHSLMIYLLALSCPSDDVANYK